MADGAPSSLTPAFNMAAAVDEAVRDFSAEIKHVSFFDARQAIISFENASEVVFYPGISGRTETDARNILKEWSAITSKNYDALHGGSSVIGLKNLILGRDPFLSSIGDIDRKTLALADELTFQHELGHIVTPWGYQNNNDGECRADAFAAIRFLQAHPGETQILRNISWERAFNLITDDDIRHFTTPVLDKIIEDSATVDFSKLTPQETIKKAEEYADRYAPRSLSRVKKAAAFLKTGFEESRDQALKDSLAAMTSTILSSPGPYTFMIGAKLFSPLFDDQQHAGLNHTTHNEIRDRLNLMPRKSAQPVFSKKLCDDFKAALISKAKKMGLSPQWIRQLEAGTPPVLALPPSAPGLLRRGLHKIFSYK